MTTFLKTHKRKWLALILGAGLILIVLVLLPRSPVPATPAVSWTPSSVLKAVPAGQSVTVPVSLTASRNLTDMVVRIAPQLQPFVDVDQPVLGDITEGETVVLTFMVSMPASAVPQTIEAVVQLRSESPPNKNFGSPLPFTILVLEQRLINMGNPTVSPQEVLSNTPTDVIVRMTIAHPDVLSADVIQVDKLGQELGTLGLLNDEGDDGDDVAGDEQYAGTILVNEPSPGQILLLVEVAVDGGPSGESGVATVSVINGNIKRWPTVETSLLRINYPPNWTANQEENRIELELPGPRTPTSPSGDIVIAIIPNPGGLTMEEYYDGNNSTNYFNDAAAIENITVDGRSAKKFLAVIGLAGSNVVVIPIPGHFVEVIDGVGTILFDSIIGTIEFFE